MKNTPYHSILERIEKDGHFYWRCHSCGILLRSHIEDHAICCIFPHEDPDSLAGAVVSLPFCTECPSQAFLKADYSMKDILEGEGLHGWQKSMETGAWAPLRHLLKSVMKRLQRKRFIGYAMKLSHSRNFRLLSMLYEVGKFPSPPLLPLLPHSYIADTPLADLPEDIVDAFWLGYMATGKAVEMDGIDLLLQQASQDMHMLPIGKLQADQKTVFYEEPDQRLPLLAAHTYQQNGITIFQQTCPDTSPVLELKGIERERGTPECDQEEK
jgi:hypothetical protein